MITLILVTFVSPEPDGMFSRLVRRALVSVRVEWVLAFCHNYIGQRATLRVNHYADRNWPGNHSRWARIIGYCRVPGLHCLTMQRA